MKNPYLELLKILLKEIEYYTEFKLQLFNDTDYHFLKKEYLNDWLSYERLLAEGYAILAKEEYDKKNK